MVSTLAALPFKGGQLSAAGVVVNPQRMHFFTQGIAQLRLHFQHLRKTPNVGDANCSPFDYFDWGTAQVSDIREANTPDYDVGIYGGGKIFGALSQYAGVLPPQGRINIAWGVSTVQSFPVSLRYARARRLMSTIGSRDYGDNRFEYAPCASCMSPLFDAPEPPTQEIVVYAHNGKSKSLMRTIPDNIPVLTNTSSNIETSLRFIASGATVVSNSYHGVYWALLMGRKVVCIPFSNKFKGYRLPPHYAAESNWLDAAKSAQAQPEMLHLVREATAAFKKKVENEIGRLSDHP